MTILGVFVILSIIIVGVIDYIEIQTRVIRNKLKKKVEDSCANLHGLLNIKEI